MTDTREHCRDATLYDQYAQIVAMNEAKAYEIVSTLTALSKYFPKFYCVQSVEIYDQGMQRTDEYFADHAIEIEYISGQDIKLKHALENDDLLNAIEGTIGMNWCKFRLLMNAHDIKYFTDASVFIGVDQVKIIDFSVKDSVGYQPTIQI